MSRTVFDNSMTAHVWAQNTQSEGRSHNGNLYFDGATLYSYGRHFIVGYVLPNGDAFLNSDSYSVSTSRHQSEARRAVRGQKFRVPNLTQFIRNPNVKFITQHACEMDIGAVKACLSYVGSGASAERIKAKSERMESERVAKRKRDDRDRLANDAKRFAACPIPEFKCNLSNVSKDERGVSYLADRSKDMFRAIKSAKAKGWTQIAAKVTERRGLLLATKRDIESRLEFYSIRQQTRDKTQLLHNIVSNMTDGQAGSSSQMAQVCNWLINQGIHINPALRAKLERLESMANASESFQSAMNRNQARKREVSQFKAWIQGERVSCPWSFREASDGSCYMRVVGDELQTSQNAKVPLKHALRVFKMVRYCVTNGIDWARNGSTIRVGFFQVDTITKKGLMVAGCHRFSWDQMCDVAQRHDLFDVATPENIAA